MNSVDELGRLTADPNVNQTSTGTTMVSFTLAVDRGKDKNGQDKGADFIQCKVFGSMADVIAKYCHKGDKLAVHGRWQTGSYENKRTGATIYTNDLMVEHFDFAGKASSNAGDYDGNQKNYNDGNNNYGGYDWGRA